MDMRADVLIVGAGMVGSALALALQGSGLQVLLLDGSPLSVKPFDAQSAFEPRVSALSVASQRILERLGVWDGVLKRRSSPYSDMQVWDGSGTGQIHFSAASVHAEVLGHIVENRVVQDALLDRLHACDLGMLANARLEQIENSLEGENSADRAIVIMSTLVGALLLSRSVADAEFAQRILDVTRDHLKNRD